LCAYGDCFHPRRSAAELTERDPAAEENKCAITIRAGMLDRSRAFYTQP
jgi:hypothetical protein